MAASSNWSLTSWKSKTNAFEIAYNDKVSARTTLEQIATLPSLVSLDEITCLKSQLSQVASGNAFLIQCGDCAELFDYCNEKSINGRVALLHRLGAIFSEVTGIPVVLIGRMAGQYGKPRNTLTEIVDGKEFYKFYGDVINGYPLHEREPNPSRMFEAYTRSGLTMNYMRQMSLDARLFKVNQPQSLVQNGIECTDPQKLPLPVFTSHETLFLHYEQSTTRSTPMDSSTAKLNYYNGSAHFIWIGDKTRHKQGAHVEYARGLVNPIGIKVGPSSNPADLPYLLNTLDPHREAGKITIITRFGADHVAEKLKPLVRAVQRSEHQVIWQCDPMHGNSRDSSSGYRTRSFSSIWYELKTTLEIHKHLGSRLGGIHLETSDEDIAECVGGPGNLKDSDLGPLYKTRCDPRLNIEQAEGLLRAAAEKVREIHGYKENKARL